MEASLQRFFPPKRNNSFVVALSLEETFSLYVFRLTRNHCSECSILSRIYSHTYSQIALQRIVWEMPTQPAAILVEAMIRMLVTSVVEDRSSIRRSRSTVSSDGYVGGIDHFHRG